MNDIDSEISQIDEDEREISKKQKLIDKRNELFSDWEFPTIIGRVQNYDNIILEFINVKK